MGWDRPMAGKTGEGLAEPGAGRVVRRSGTGRPRLRREAVRRVEAGRHQELFAGEAVGEGRITVSAFCRLTDDVPRAAWELKPICARIAQNGGAPFLALAGLHLLRPSNP